ncbi:calcium-binding protein [Azospirillum soli]|uniref:calcium-binding protein n=1 Tax=Azospirillum soli TaxID=1304799 RepID=UPI001AE96A61|nr:calcium-binding protein [Azospirillum soli]MBP2316287.1 Ca2+-binding RTX toxin-like protein [Azospirillum soli]
MANRFKLTRGGDYNENSSEDIYTTSYANPVTPGLIASLNEWVILGYYQNVSSPYPNNVSTDPSATLGRVRFEGYLQGEALYSRWTVRADPGSASPFIPRRDNAGYLFDWSAGTHKADMTGGSFADRLIGSPYADTLAGGLGADTLTGGAGKDLIHGTPDELDGDTITEVGLGEDQIRIDGVTGSFLGLQNTVVDGGLDLGGGRTLTFDALPAGMHLGVEERDGSTYLTLYDRFAFSSRADSHTDAAGNDFRAYSYNTPTLVTFSTGDSISGGDGTDTLDVVLEKSTTTGAATVSGFETLNVTVLGDANNWEQGTFNAANVSDSSIKLLGSAVINVTNASVSIDGSGMQGYFYATFTGGDVKVVGSARYDTFDFGTTLDGNDTVIGGANDVVRATITDWSATAARPSITGVENLVLNGTNLGTVDMGSVSGASQVEFTGNGDVTVTGLGVGSSTMAVRASTLNGRLTLTQDVSCGLTVYGSQSADTIKGGSGSNSIYLGGGNDSMIGGTGFVWAEGGLGDDFVDGRASMGFFAGEDGNDTLLGGAHPDWLSGGADADSLSGGGGADTLRGDSGADTLTGGAGADIFRIGYFDYGDIDVITDFTSEDRIIFADDYGWSHPLSGPIAEGRDFWEIPWQGAAVEFVGGDAIVRVDNDTRWGGGDVLAVRIANIGNRTLKDFAVVNGALTVLPLPPPPPADSGGSDGGGSSGGGQTSTQTIGGTTVQTTVTTGGNGIPSVSVSVTPPTGATPVAVPITGGSSGTAITATVPAGVGLSASGPQNPVTPDRAASALTASVAALESDPARSAELAQAIAGYTGSLPAGASLTVRTITPSVSGGVPGAPITITGGGAGGEAMVIDTRALPPGTQLNLDNVGFVVIVGNALVGGGAGSQVAYGDGSGQTFVLGADDDTLHGGGGDDFVGSKGGNDVLYGDEGNDTVQGGEDNDTLFGGSDNDLLLGNTGADVLLGNMGADTLYGGRDTDTLYGGRDADALFGNDAADRMHGDDGADRLFGNTGSDLLLGNMGADTLYGGMDNDTLHGGRDDDALFGDTGDDFLYGDFGNDMLTGGAGADLFVLTGGAGHDVIADFNDAEGDRISMTLGLPYAITSNAAGEAVIVFGQDDRVTLSGIRVEQVQSGWFVFG